MASFFTSVLVILGTVMIAVPSSTSPVNPKEEKPRRSNRGRSDADKPNSLAEFLQQVYNSPALDGDVLYSARRFCNLQFAFDYSVLAELADYRALLQLYKLPYRNQEAKKDRRMRNRRRNRNQEPAEVPEEARVTVYQVLDPGANDQLSIKLLDTQLVSLSSRGWVYLDVTSAVSQWANDADLNLGLEVWIESAHSGRHGVRWARKTKFVRPNSDSKSRLPELVIRFEQTHRNTLDNMG